ncbi:MAG: TetR/AcrR family transcriptional regulator [Bacillota bacterium]|nr:TetR/AcrR family transcriptional regulator [Bacillota bacterium]
MKDDWEKELNRQRDSRRNEIICSAEKLFLLRDLPGVSMMDIASNVGISRVTLYKYYNSIDEIAFEVQMKILKAKEIVSRKAAAIGTNALEKVRNVLLAQFDLYRKRTDSFRYIGLFDHYYRHNYPTKELEERYRDFLKDCPPIPELINEGLEDGSIRSDIPAHKLAVFIGNSFISVAERMASRGNILRHEQNIDPDEQVLQVIEMIVEYIKADRHPST